MKNLARLALSILVASFLLSSCASDQQAVTTNEVNQVVEPLTKVGIVEVALVDPLNSNQGNYCIDSLGARENARPEEGLQAYTCYTYAGNHGYDQTMDAEDIAKGRFRLTGFDVCMQAASASAGSTISASTCDDSALQNFNLLPDRTIRLKSAGALCLSVGDDTRFGRGGPTGHQYKDLTLEPCTAERRAHQQWYLRDNLGRGTFSKMSADGVERSIERVAGDIYRFHHNHWSSLFVLTEEDVILVDPLNVPVAKWVKGEIESIFGKQVSHVLYSHGHEDHASGAAVFGDVEVISHKNTFDVISSGPETTLYRRFAGFDKNGDGVLDSGESEGQLAEYFSELDLDKDGVVTGQETGVFNFKDVVPPTQPYDGNFHEVTIGGKKIELHFVGGNHSADMNYIFFPEESLVFYVDIIGLRGLPYGPLPWYSPEDSENTYNRALAIDAKIAVPSHGPIGTQDDVRDLRDYMVVLRSGVKERIDAGQSLEEIKTSMLLEDYTDWDYYAERRVPNIEGMHRALTSE